MTYLPKPTFWWTSASTISSTWEGSYDNDSPHTNIGSLHARAHGALQSRAAFLNGRPSYLLYFWEVADSHQLLQSSLQRLTSNTGAVDASIAPGGSRDSRSQHGRHHGKDQEEEHEILMPVLQSFFLLTKNGLNHNNTKSLANVFSNVEQNCWMRLKSIEGWMLNWWWVMIGVINFLSSTSANFDFWKMSFVSWRTNNWRTTTAISS